MKKPTPKKSILSTCIISGLAILLSSCGDSSKTKALVNEPLLPDNPPPTSNTQKTTLAGSPTLFKPGSTVTIQAALQSSKNILRNESQPTSIKEDGTFELNTELSGNLEVSIKGPYFDMGSGQFQEKTLRSKIVLEGGSSTQESKKSINVNSITNLVAERTDQIIKSGRDFKEAKQVAEREVRHIFIKENKPLSPKVQNFETYSLQDSTWLLALEGLISSSSEMIHMDFLKDGQLYDPLDLDLQNPLDLEPLKQNLGNTFSNLPSSLDKIPSAIVYSFEADENGDSKPYIFAANIYQRSQLYSKIIALDEADSESSLSLSIIKNGEYGIASIDGDYLHYLPNSDMDEKSIQDTVSVKIKNSLGLSTEHTVNIDLLPKSINSSPEKPPVVKDDHTVNTVQGTGPVSINLSELTSHQDNKKIVGYAVYSSYRGKTTISENSASFTPDQGYSMDGLGDFGFKIIAFDSNSVESIPTYVQVQVEQAPATPIPESTPSNTSSKPTLVDLSQGATATFNISPNDANTADTHTFTLKTPPTKGSVTITANGEATYTASDFGSDQFTVIVTDQTGLEGEITIYVTNNHPPILSTTPASDATSPILTHGTNVVTIDTLVTDSDLNDTSTLSITSQGGLGQATINNQQVIYTPTTGSTGTDQFTITVMDAAGAADSQTVFIENTNATPTIQALQTSDSNNRISAYGTNPLAIDLNTDDVDGDTLTLSIANQGTLGSAAINNNQVIYTPSGALGLDQFDVVVNDGFGGEASTTIFIENKPALPTSVTLSLSYTNTHSDLVGSLDVTITEPSTTSISGDCAIDSSSTATIKQANGDKGLFVWPMGISTGSQSGLMSCTYDVTGNIISAFVEGDFSIDVTATNLLGAPINITPSDISVSIENN